MGEQIAHWVRQQASELRAHALLRLQEFHPVWRRARAAARLYSFRVERAEINSDWRRRPSTFGSIAVHSLLLLGILIWAHPWAKAGGPSKVVSVQVVMMRSSVADTVADGAPQHSSAPLTPSIAATPAEPSRQANETVVASEPSTDASAAARQEATPLPQAESESADTSAKAVTPGSPSNTSATAKDSAVNGAPVAAGSQNVALQNAVRNQMLACWNVPFMAGRRGLMALDFDILLNPDGTLARTPELVPAMAEEIPHNPALRAAADAARVALKFCAPFRLPRETYDQWHEINPFHFDPAEFLRR